MRVAPIMDYDAYDNKMYIDHKYCNLMESFVVDSICNGIIVGVTNSTDTLLRRYTYTANPNGTLNNIGCNNYFPIDTKYDDSAWIDVGDAWDYIKTNNNICEIVDSSNEEIMKKPQ